MRTLPFKENVMYGLTHNEDGSPIIRVPRALKVGIGIPRGKALRVFIHPTDKATPWYLGEGYYDGKSLKEKWHKFATREACEAKYVELRDRTSPAVPECTYPRKLKFFTFSKPSVTDKGGEVYEPDFDAIEAHGPTPTRIPIVFMSADVYRMGFQLWSATELRCKGDGINAMRSVLMGSDKDEGWKAAVDAKDRYFPIVGGCMQRGCPYGEKKECKPGLGLNFQTANHFMIGTTATFHTTGWESCRRTFSSFTAIKEAVERATGRDVSSLGVFLVMRPYMTHPKGQKAQQQQAVHVELPLKAQQSLVAQLRALYAEIDDQRQIEAPAASRQTPVVEDLSIIDAEEDMDGEVDESPIGAAAMAAEFYNTEDPESSAPEPATTTAAAPSTATQGAVGEKLKRARSVPAPAAAPVASTTEAAPPWTDNDTMRAAFKVQRDKHADHYAAVMKGYSGELVWDNPETLRIYAEISAGPVTEVAAATDTEDLF